MDCGGPDCDRCADGQVCVEDADCTTEHCVLAHASHSSGFCQGAPTGAPTPASSAGPTTTAEVHDQGQTVKTVAWEVFQNGALLTKAGVLISFAMLAGAIVMCAAACCCPSCSAGGKSRPGPVNLVVNIKERDDSLESGGFEMTNPMNGARNSGGKSAAEIEALKAQVSSLVTDQKGLVEKNRELKKEQMKARQSGGVAEKRNTIKTKKTFGAEPKQNPMEGGDWEKKYDPTYKTHYWENAKTGESQWEDPNK